MIVKFFYQDSMYNFFAQIAVDRVMEKLQSLPKKDHLVPLFINAETGKLRPGTLTLGARADTYYEYLFKQWIQCSKTEQRYVSVGHNVGASPCMRLCNVTQGKKAEKIYHT